MKRTGFLIICMLVFCFTSLADGNISIRCPEGNLIHVDAKGSAEFRCMMSLEGQEEIRNLNLMMEADCGKENEDPFVTCEFKAVNNTAAESGNEGYLWMDLLDPGETVITGSIRSTAPEKEATLTIRVCDEEYNDLATYTMTIVPRSQGSDTATNRCIILISVPAVLGILLRVIARMRRIKRN